MPPRERSGSTNMPNMPKMTTRRRGVVAAILAIFVAAIAWAVRSQSATPQEKHEELLVKKMKKLLAYTARPRAGVEVNSFCNLANEYKETYPPLTFKKVNELLRQAGAADDDSLYDAWKAVIDGGTGRGDGVSEEEVCANRLF